MVAETMLHFVRRFIRLLPFLSCSRFFTTSRGYSVKHEVCREVARLQLPLGTVFAGCSRLVANQVIPPSFRGEEEEKLRGRVLRDSTQRATWSFLCGCLRGREESGRRLPNGCAGQH